MITDETLSIEEAAALAKVGVDCMKTLVDTGEIFATRLNQKHCVLLREDVIDFLRRRAREQAKQRRDRHAGTNATTTPRSRAGRRRNALPVLADGVH